MKYFLLAILFAMFSLGCGGNSPTAPAIQPANIVAIGNLTTLGCFFTSDPTLAVCSVFNGVAQNTGAGCATNVRGVLTTYTVPGNLQVGSAAWSRAGIVRPNEQIAFSGGPLTVGVPLTGGWMYLSNITWDNVAC